MTNPVLSDDPEPRNSLSEHSGEATLVAPEQLSSTCLAAVNFIAIFVEVALLWFAFGFNVIPILPGTKFPAVKWDPWLDGLSTDKIRDHWAKHPDHEVGFIVGDDFIVFDADSPASISALTTIETAFGITPTMVVKTTKGEHHYYQRTNGTYARSDSHSTEKHPERIDVKTGRALVILPPSTGKTLVIDEVHHARK